MTDIIDFQNCLPVEICGSVVDRAWPTFEDDQDGNAISGSTLHSKESHTRACTKSAKEIRTRWPSCTSRQALSSTALLSDFWAIGRTLKKRPSTFTRKSGALQDVQRRARLGNSMAADDYTDSRYRPPSCEEDGD